MPSTSRWFASRATLANGSGPELGMIDDRDVDAEVAHGFDPRTDLGIDEVALHDTRNVGRADPFLREGGRRDAREGD